MSGFGEGQVIVAFILFSFSTTLAIVPKMNALESVREETNADSYSSEP